MTAKSTRLLRALKEEKAKRQQARQSLLAFTEYTFPEYQAADHHKLIARTLEAVEAGKIDRLMVTMPPRHGKSELVTKRFPAWWLGLHPRGQVITASYNSDLARDFGRSVRNIVNGRRYANVFQTRLAADSQAADRWNTNQDGAYVAAGVGTAVTGRGADLLIIDDPLKDRAEADSELKRDTIYDWYTSTAYTRLMPGGSVIVVQTRWHEDDLAGRLLEREEDGGDSWFKLDLPAINTDGDALWPSRYGL
ncbi:MAG: terminase family protein, partial [Pseudomonadota bacterium]